MDRNKRKISLGVGLMVALIVLFSAACEEERECCVYCCETKPCGDSCISVGETCTKEDGCACSGCQNLEQVDFEESHGEISGDTDADE